MKAGFFLVSVLAGYSCVNVSLAEDSCIKRYQAEQKRIEKELARQRPDMTDEAAKERWSQRLHAELEKVANAAEQCSRAKKKPLSPEARRRFDDCTADVASRLSEVDRQFAGRSLSFEEQTVQRTRQQALLDERSSCQKLLQH